MRQSQHKSHFPKQLMFVVGFSLASTAWAGPVKEYVDPETGALVFDATEKDATDFDVPLNPREFDDVPSYLSWVLERFHGRPIYGEKGELIDVQGGWVLVGQPTYVFEGRLHVVSQPILQTISGPFGFVIIGGEKYEMPLDEPLPEFEEIEPALYSLIGFRRSCMAAAPLGGVDYCLVSRSFKHIYIFYQSIGATVDIAGKAIVRPSTTVSLSLSFRDAFGRILQISTPTTTVGNVTVERKGVGGIGIAEWGVFGNPFIDPTKQLRITGKGAGPQSDGLSGAAELNWTQRY